ncbi:MAG TPA: hypothetical protein VJ910_00425 [Desulfuromonadales bacterium]|nr:hypothetical protein [Desulfuromonadales bacterium]
MPHALSHLMHREVAVDAAEMTLTGILREVTEEHVVLWTAKGWRSIPHDRIKGVRPAGEGKE